MSTDRNADRRSVALSEVVHDELVRHLRQHIDRGSWQEDLCFALWRPSKGAKRTSAMIFEVVLPHDEDRVLRGNVAFRSQYLERALRLAQKRGCGLAFLHSHFTPGWQGMSDDDVLAESGLAPSVLATTSFPLVGMTLGTDGAWSGRFWERHGRRDYRKTDCYGVRVVGEFLQATYHPHLTRRRRAADELCRTISVWGDVSQAHVSGIHAGIVGLGSVGSIICESLARIGVQRVTLIDHDVTKRRNRDRTLGVTAEDAEMNRLKVDVASRQFLAAPTAQENPVIRSVGKPLQDGEAFAAALDCDVLFSCVDRHWPRHLLNYIAHCHLIPVIDGGIRVRVPNGKFKGAEWSAYASGPGRACLACAERYVMELVDVERRGLLDDPRYLVGATDDPASGENAFPFSLSVASMEMLQFVALVTGLMNYGDLGEQRYLYYPSAIVRQNHECLTGCVFKTLVGSGDSIVNRDRLLK